MSSLPAPASADFPVPSEAVAGLAKVLVLIPALDEAGSIGGVIARLQALSLRRIRVVDNGSLDGTPEVAAAAGAEVLHELRRGYGMACWRGLQALPAETEWVLFCDADGCDVLEDLPRLLARRADADFILGDRQATDEGRRTLTPVQRFGNALCGSLIGLAWGWRFHDLGPMRLIRRSTLEALQMQDRGFGWTVEMQAKAAARGLRCAEVPVGYRPRRAGKSKISGTIRGTVMAGTIILSTLASVWWREGLGARLGSRAGQAIAGLGGALLLILGAVLMAPHGDFRQPGAVPPFLTGAAVMAAGFFLLLAQREVGAGRFWLVTLAPRLILLFAMFPGDDLFRYLWEGWIQTHRFNPYAQPPDAPELAALRTAWWAGINHPHLAAIYPPLAQLGFRLLALAGPTVLLFKAAFVLADLALAGLLARRFGWRAALVYAANPLAIYHFAGGGHYDSWFLLALAAGWFASEDGRLRQAALWLGAGVALKYVCAPAVAFLLWKNRRALCRPRLAALAGLAALPMVAAFLLIPDAFATRSLAPGEFAFGARSAELVPWLVEQVWPSSRGWNQIFLVPFAAALCWLFVRCRSMTAFLDHYFPLLLVLAPVVHGWYFTWLLPVAAATRNPGTLALSATGFVYFWTLHRSLTLGLDWTQPWPLKALLWGPFFVGWAWHARRQRQLAS